MVTHDNGRKRIAIKMWYLAKATRTCFFFLQINQNFTDFSRATGFFSKTEKKSLTYIEYIKQDFWLNFIQSISKTWSMDDWTQQFKILNHNTSLQALNHLKKRREISLVSTDYNILSILTFPSNSHNDSTCISSFINHTLCLYKIKPYKSSFYLNAGLPSNQDKIIKHIRFKSYHLTWICVCRKK